MFERNIIAVFAGLYKSFVYLNIILLILREHGPFIVAWKYAKSIFLTNDI